jgi:diacylglycerol kinase (ATP)
VGSEAALGIVPAGVGNDFARGLGIPLQMPGACQVLAQGSVRTVDVGRANGRYFFSVAVSGLAAEVNRRANQLSWLPLPGIYMITTLATIFAYQPLRFTVSADGHESCYYGWMMAAGNTWSCAAGMALLPAAQPDDGLLDVCIVEGIGRGQLLFAFPRVFLGSHVYHKGVETVRVREMTVQADSPCDVYADGERVGSLPVTLSVVPHALKVIVPKSASPLNRPYSHSRHA